MEESLDVIIIGAGTAGLSALREVRKRTAHFALINDGPYGTTCARVGCMPSKVLIEAANAFHRRHTFTDFGIRGGESLRIDLPAVLQRVRALRDRFVAGALRATADLGERNISGRARLLGPDRVAVGDRELTARSIIIATGSRPVIPAGWEAYGDRLLTSDTLFEQESLPARVGVIGLGPVGIELSQALARLGITVHGFGTNSRLAGIEDPALAGLLTGLLQREFQIHIGPPVELSAAADGIRISSGTHAATVDRVLVAAGRRPNVDDLGLESLGVAMDARGLPSVDPATLQVADLPVFLAGDANGQSALMHEAADEGHIAGINALATSPDCFRRRTPLAIVFCDPGVAMVGRRGSELDPDTTLCGESDFTVQSRARAAQRNQGLLRIHAERQGGRLLGAGMCVPAAEHLAHLLALAIERGLTVHELLRMPFYHPVLEEGLRTALRDLARQLPATGASDLACCEGFRCEALD